MSVRVSTISTDDLQALEWSSHRAGERPRFGVAVLSGDDETLILTVEMTPEQMIDLATGLLKNAADAKRFALVADLNPTIKRGSKWPTV
jgi:hypothetical protein